jgi:hypothetical protein
MTPRSRRSVGTTICAVLAIAAAACTAEAPIAVDLGIADHINATPSIAAHGRFVSVVWGATSSGASTDVYTAISRDGGRSFDGPVRVNSVTGAARLNGEQPPLVTLLDRSDADPAIVVVWTARGANGTILLQSRSDDGGTSFVPQTVVPGSDAVGNRGWHAITATADRRIAALWLDHRETASETVAGGAHHHHGAAARSDAAAGPGADSAIRAQKSKLYFGLLDGEAPDALTGGVCYCCKTALTSGADGSLYAGWRHVYPGNIRDIAFTVSRDGGRTFAPPVRVSDDKWVLNGCPENGPSMAVDAAGRVHMAWPTLIEQGGRGEALTLFYAMSRDGRTFTARQALPTQDVPRHVQIAAAPDGQVVAAWDEGAGGARRVAFARGVPDEASGAIRFTRSVQGNDTAATYPALAIVGDQVLAAWTSGIGSPSMIRVEPVVFTDH